MLLIAVYCRRCGRNLRAKLYTAINSLSANHAHLKTLYTPLESWRGWSSPFLKPLAYGWKYRYCLWRTGSAVHSQEDSSADLQYEVAPFDERMLFERLEQVAGEVQHVLAMTVHHERSPRQLSLRLHLSYVVRCHFRHHRLHAAEVPIPPRFQLPVVYLWVPALSKLRCCSDVSSLFFINKLSVSGVGTRTFSKVIVLKPS